MAQRRLGRYDVRIYQISCEDLVGKDRSGKSDPYVKFDFDKYRKFNTPVLRKTLNPSWDTDESFKYATQYPDRLMYKHLLITVQDKDFWGKDYIGSVKVDLHTLLTGPVCHNLTINNKGEPAGRIKFKLEMTEIVNFKVKFKSAGLTGLPRINGREPSTSLHFSTDVTEHKLSVTTQVQNETSNPEWLRVEQLRFNTHLRELFNTQLRMEVLESGHVIGSAKIPFRLNYPKRVGDDVRIQADVVMNDGSRGVKFDAIVYYKEFPTTAHMVGGEHTDNGIIYAQYFHPIVDRPKYCKVHGADDGKRQNGGGGGGGGRESKAAAAVAVVTGTVSSATNRNRGGRGGGGGGGARPALPSSRPPALPATAPPAGGPARVIGVGAVRGSHIATGSANVVVSTAPVLRKTMSRGGGGGGGGGGVSVGGGARPAAVVQPVVSGQVLTGTIVTSAAPRVISSAPAAVTVQPTVVTTATPTSYLNQLHPADRERTIRMGLPAPWSCHVAPDGRPYYVNHVTKKTQWIPPTVRQQQQPKPHQPANVQLYGQSLHQANFVNRQPAVPVARPIHQPRQQPMVHQVTHTMASMQLAKKCNFPPVNTQSLYTLTNMGFGSDLAKESLARNQNNIQNAIQWLSTNPVPLSPSWDLRVDKKSHRLYYANKEGKFTQWDRPIISQKHEPMLKSLLAMGFPRRCAVEALAHYKGDAQAATNWILYNQPKPLPSTYAILVENGAIIYLNKTNNQRYSTRPVKPTF